MSTIDPLSRLVGVLRQQSLRGQKQSSTQRAAKNDGSRTGEAKSLPELRGQISQQLSHLDPTDELGRAKATHLVIESILAFEFGDELLLDAELSPLVERIVYALDEDPAMSLLIDNLLAVKR